VDERKNDSSSAATSLGLWNSFYCGS